MSSAECRIFGWITAGSFFLGVLKLHAGVASLDQDLCSLSDLILHLYIHLGQPDSFCYRFCNVM